MAEGRPPRARWPARPRFDNHEHLESDSEISWLGIRENTALQQHPKVGQSFEGFAIHQVVQAIGAEPEECFFWGVHTGGELDLLVVGGERYRVAARSVAFLVRLPAGK